MSDDDVTVFRPGGVTYLRIPAPNPTELAAFYQAVFGWALDERRSNPKFEDATGHVIGHFMPDLPVAGESGVIPYVYVESVDGTLEAAVARGAHVATAPYAEGDLRVATLRDPAGNLIGVWQRSGS
jgi:predicted enzyme related to lactoylglutathione lyase